MRRLSFLTVMALLLCSAVLGAQTAGRAPTAPQTPPPPPANAVKVTGKVVDPSGGVMVGADVQVLVAGTPPRLVAVGKTNSDGEFEVAAAPGPYQIKITVPGGDFKDINQSVRVAANMAPLSYTMTIGVETVIDVKSVTNELGVDPDSSLNTDVITGDALLDLPDNEDDLLAYLTQLAQLRGGDGEVTLAVDGFTNATIPPLAQIAEIRIVNSSFSADGSNGPRIEIVTKAGSGKWTASTTLGFNDESLNALNHLSTGKRPKSQKRNFSLNSNGPLIPGRLSLNANMAKNESDAGNDLRAYTPNGFVSQGITSINRVNNFTLNPRLMINKVHNLNTSFTYRTSKVENNGVGGYNLPERASNNDVTNWQLQISDRITKGKVVDTLRFQQQHNTTSNVPLAVDPATSAAYVTNPNTGLPYSINVTGAFNAGPSPNNTHSTTQDFLLGNTMQWQPNAKLTFSALAFELNYHSSDSKNQNNYNGTYTFPGLYDYCAVIPGQTVDFSVGPQCGVEYQKRLELKAAYDNDQYNKDHNLVLDITPKSATKFDKKSGNPDISVNQVEFAVWAQGDWRYSPRAVVSFGLRYQVQQHFSDYNNFAPVAGLSYQLRTKGNWKTVVRAGVKSTVSTFSMSTYSQLQQSSVGSAQQTVTILTPSFPDATQGGSLNAPASILSIRRLADAAAQPYQVNPQLSWEQSMPRGMTAVVTYNITHGYRQNRNVNINAPWPGTDLPSDLQKLLNSPDSATKASGRAIVDSMRPYYLQTTGDIIETQSVGKSLNHQVNFQYRLNNYALFNNKFRINGNVTYTIIRGKDDSQFEDQYDRLADYARTTGTGSRVNAQINVNAPRRITLSLQNIGWQSGRPYSWTVGSDTNGDGNNTDRPFDQARNQQTGPGSLSLTTARLTKIFILTTPKPTASPSLGRLVSSFAEPEPEPAQGGGGGGGFGGGGGGGGFNGGGGRNGGNNPNRIPNGARTLSFNIQASNVFNRSVQTNINGQLSSPLFGKVTGGSQGRQVTLGMTVKLF